MTSGPWTHFCYLPSTRAIPSPHLALHTQDPCIAFVSHVPSPFFRFSMQTADTPQPLVMHHVQTSSFTKFQCHTNVIIHQLAWNQVPTPDFGPWSLRFLLAPSGTPLGPLVPDQFRSLTCMEPCLHLYENQILAPDFHFWRHPYFYLDLTIPMKKREEPHTEERKGRQESLYLRKKGSWKEGEERIAAKLCQNENSKQQTKARDRPIPFSVRPVHCCPPQTVCFECNLILLVWGPWVCMGGVSRLLPWAFLSLF